MAGCKPAAWAHMPAAGTPHPFCVRPSSPPCHVLPFRAALAAACAVFTTAVLAAEEEKLGTVIGIDLGTTCKNTLGHVLHGAMWSLILIMEALCTAS